MARSSRSIELSIRSMARSVRSMKEARMDSSRSVLSSTVCVRCASVATSGWLGRTAAAARNSRVDLRAADSGYPGQGFCTVSMLSVTVRRAGRARQHRAGADVERVELASPRPVSVTLQSPASCEPGRATPA